MQCKDAQAMLDAWIDGELPEALEKAVEGHLEICRICAAEAEDLRLLTVCLDSHPPVQPSGHLLEKTVTAFALESGSENPASWRDWWRTLGWKFQTAMAASVLMGLGLGCHLGGSWTGSQLLNEYCISGILFSAGEFLLSWT